MLAQWVGICGVRLRVFIYSVVFSGIAHIGRTIFKSKTCFVVIVMGYIKAQASLPLGGGSAGVEEVPLKSNTVRSIPSPRRN